MGSRPVSPEPGREPAASPWTGGVGPVMDDYEHVDLDDIDFAPGEYEGERYPCASR
ncbi:hypothetical protein GCM10010350_38650 [Streptomyces galilaeus]|nr:hypothetical protein GCM10010350_38650 [Streptomyces galilaeus]